MPHYIYATVVLLCSGALSEAECTKHNASDIWYAEPGQSPMMCGFYGMSSVAGSHFHPRNGEWVKITCERIEVDPD